MLNLASATFSSTKSHIMQGLTVINSPLINRFLAFEYVTSNLQFWTLFHLNLILLRPYHFSIEYFLFLILLKVPAGTSAWSAIAQFWLHKPVK